MGGRGFISPCQKDTIYFPLIAAGNDDWVIRKE
jgi:hypothetical protein